MSCTYYSFEDYAQFARNLEGFCVRKNIYKPRFDDKLQSISLNFCYFSKDIKDIEKQVQENCCSFFDYLGFVLHWYNEDAYVQRYYKHGETKDSTLNIKDFKSLRLSKTSQEKSLLEMLNNFKCIDYQCVDSDAYLKSELRKIIKDLITALEKDVIDSEIDKNKIQWGI